MVETFEAESLEELANPEMRKRALEVLESGNIIHLPNYSFQVTECDRPLVDPENLAKLRRGKPRASGRPTLLYHQGSGSLRGGSLQGVSKRDIKSLLSRYADWSRELAMALLPAYGPTLEQEFTTFRPCERTRPQGLHMDAAMARPTQGRCWMRVFNNVNLGGVPRRWQVGEHFEQFAERFVPRLPDKVGDRFPGASPMLQLLGIAKGRATPYDHTMRALRDMVMKDAEYQKTVGRTEVEFSRGSTWIALADIVLHGALAGQHSLDQSFLFPATAMQDPEGSSLRILERLTGRALV